MIRELGIQKTTLLDFPGIVAATLFTAGCPLRCPYCHNPELVAGPAPPHFVPRAEALAIVADRVGRIEGVCITGGEPLVHADLGELIGEIRGMGLRVKLDSCGMFPDRLQAILAAGAVDLVAIDLKTAPAHYERVHGDGERVRRSLEVLRRSGTPFIARTTAAPGIVTRADIPAIAQALEPGETIQINQFRPGTTLHPDWRDCTPYAPAELEQWCRVFRDYGIGCSVRGIA